VEIIQKEPHTAAELLLRECSKLRIEATPSIIRDEQMLYCTPAPTGVMANANYMKNKLTFWKDAFFEMCMTCLAAVHGVILHIRRILEGLVTVTGDRDRARSQKGGKVCT